MKRYAAVLSVLAMILMPAVVQAQFDEGDWELTLSGSGNNDHDFDTGAASLVGSLGYFFTPEWELVLRQGVIWSDGGSSWNGDTRIAVDYHFNQFDNWVPFVGGIVGYQYGDDFEDQAIAGPEVGVKYFLNTTTFIQATASYMFSLEESFNDGAFFYGLGLGVRL